ncbi:hypothetical protein [Streptomyces physcomitrii]|uniref:Phenylacetate-CoA ligase n=1 Tax=Streptomyces physcomitrii TaxID=2724184 RepID=A0ABX1H5U7_9ACTN|nr:hypothetical protein [Streptomyces physcomitrii]NKI42604.1 hypothetical protein [Streptomyces physcomitrii]
MSRQPTPEEIEEIRGIPLYQPSLAQGYFPVLEKPVIAEGFPENWMTPALAAALDSGDAEFVLSTGTNHARMQIIRPPYFLLHSYYRLWSEHPDIAETWEAGCPRVSLTTVMATEHVARVNARKRGGEPAATPALDDRRLDARTVYLNLSLDPALWDRAEVGRMIEEIRSVQASHPSGRYHLDCSTSHLAHLVRKAADWGLWADFPRPASIIHAYEYTPATVRRFLRARFDCPIVDLFGSTELGYLYYSDAEGAYHPYLDRMSVELLETVPDSGLYSLIVTSLRNPYMPLIRYRSGDVVRTLDGGPDPARISRFTGREKELLPTPHGPLSQGDLDEAVAAAAPGVFQHQLRLYEGERAELAYTTFTGEPLDGAAERVLAEAAGSLTGRPCRAAHRDHIPIGRSGKYAWLAAHS